jgi:hypothetical protein
MHHIRLSHNRLLEFLTLGRTLFALGRTKAFPEKSHFRKISFAHL